MNEPIGLFKLKEDHHGSYYIQALPTEDNHNLIPLYTHPVKELTDAELYELLPVNLRADEEDAFMFARAILRKAQEK